MGKRSKKQQPTVSVEQTSRARDMRLEPVVLDELRSALRNPKQHALEPLSASLAEHGAVEPPALDERTGRLVAGHGRVEALRLMRERGEPPPAGVLVDEAGVWRVPVLRGWSSRDDAEAERYLARSNRLTELGGWDDSMLRELLAEQPRDFALDLDWGAVKEWKLADPDDAPEPPAEPVSKLGDVWTLGDHALLCGSCEDLGVGMGDERARLLVTDPPYGVSYVGSLSVQIKTSRAARDAIAGDESTADFFERLTGWLRAIRALLAPGASYYVFAASCAELSHASLSALLAAGFPLRQQLVWVKDAFVLGRSDYHYRHESIAYGWLDGAAHHRVEDRTECSVWEAKRPNRSALHPTMKPVELYARAMRNSSARGDLVLEPFAGSGTALVAAEQEGRRVVASEVSPAYCDVIVERWQQLTGGKARRA